MKVATLFMRLGLGYIFFMAGMRKFYDPAPLKPLVEKFEIISMDSATFLFLIGIAQSIVGLALIIGFYTRVMAAIATISLLISLMFFFREKDIALIGTSLALVITGSCFLSFDKSRA